MITRMAGVILPVRSITREMFFFIPHVIITKINRCHNTRVTSVICKFRLNRSITVTCRARTNKIMIFSKFLNFDLILRHDTSVVEQKNPMFADGYAVKVLNGTSPVSID